MWAAGYKEQAALRVPLPLSGKCGLKVLVLVTPGSSADADRAAPGSSAPSDNHLKEQWNRAPCSCPGTHLFGVCVGGDDKHGLCLCLAEHAHPVLLKESRTQRRETCSGREGGSIPGPAHVPAPNVHPLCQQQEEHLSSPLCPNLV